MNKNQYAIAYDLPMLRCAILWLIAAFPAISLSQAISANPVPSYKMKVTEKRSKMGTQFSIAPDQSLLFFVGDEAGKWELARVSAWDSSSPKRERLALKGPSRDEIENARFGQSSFLLTNDGHFALARFETDAPGMASSFRKNSEAVISVIDLHSYTVVSTLKTSDHILAGGFWQPFQEHSILAGYGANEKTADGAVFTRESVSLLDVPTMHASIECNYLLHYGETKQDGHGASSRATSNSDVSSGCAELMQKTNALEPEGIQKFQEVGSAVKTLNSQTSQWHDCSFVEEKVDDKTALYDCGKAHQTWHDTYKQDSRAFFVVDVSTAAQLLRISVNPSKSAIGHLTIHEGKTWLAVLTDHVELALYRVR